MWKVCFQICSNYNLYLKHFIKKYNDFFWNLHDIYKLIVQHKYLKVRNYSFLCLTDMNIINAHQKHQNQKQLDNNNKIPLFAVTERAKHKN